MPTETAKMRRLNFLDVGAESKLDLRSDQVPTLVPSDVMKEWNSGDDDPYYKLQKIEYPIRANGLVYEESFFESFISKLNERPIPGSKLGHTWGPGRGPTDLILVGAKIEKNGDGTGSVYFKNYIPPVGESGTNEVFIKENKSDMIHFSLVTYPKEIIETSDEGTTIRIVESLFGERNDAVEYGTGAMKQVTNSEVEIKDGIDDNVSNEAERGKAMDKDELLKKLNALKQNGEITLIEIATHLKLENQVMTDETREAVRIVNELKKDGVDDPISEFKRLKSVEKDGEEAKRQNALTEAFGPAKFADGKDNLVRKYANDKLDAGVKIDDVKEDPIMKRLQAEQADYTSEMNKLGVVESNGKETDSGPVVADY
jgi:hypothetical protein